MAKRDHAEVCAEVCTHPEILEKVAPEMPDEERLYDLAELFKVFGDTTRIRILYVLFESEMCVCDIAALLNMTQSAISHQLRILKQARLVRSRRDGKTVFYSLDTSAPSSARAWSISKKSMGGKEHEKDL